MRTERLAADIVTLSRRTDGPLTRKARKECVRRLRELSANIGVPCPAFDPSADPVGTLHLAGMLPTLHDDALRSARLGRALDAAVDAARAVDTLHAYNVSLQAFFPTGAHDLREKDKVSLLIAFDQWDTAFYVADQARLAAAIALHAADRMAWISDAQAALDERHRLVGLGSGVEGVDASMVAARGDAWAKFSDIVSRLEPVHEIGLDPYIGPAIKDRIEFVSDDDCVPDGQAVSAAVH